MAIETSDGLMEAELSRDGALTISVEWIQPEAGCGYGERARGRTRCGYQEKQTAAGRRITPVLSERMETVQGEIEVKARAIRDFQEGEGIIDVQAQTTAMVELTKVL